MYKETQNRNIYYDILKGMAISLVVLGHAIQYNMSAAFDNNILFRLIYSCHMPLFMFISGMVSFASNSYDVNWLGRRAISLCFPFVSWIIITAESKDWKALLERFKMVIKEPECTNWFLWILFLNCLLLYTIYRVRINNKILLSFFGCFLLSIVSQKIKILGIGSLAWYSVFFLSGHFVAKYKEKLNKQKYKIGIMGLIIWLILAPFWRRVELPGFYKILSCFLNHQFVLIAVRLYNYLVGFSGTIMFMFFGYSIVNTKVSRLFELLGKRTIEIYLLQWFFFGLFPWGENVLWIRIVFDFIFGLLCPYLVAIVFEEHWDRLLLFGKKSQF